MPYVDALDDLVETARGQRLLVIASIALALFVFIDAAVVHTFIWGNEPTLFYFTVKPVFVGAGLVGVSWLIMRSTSAGDLTAILVGALVGVVYLQLYYTVVPIPVVDGPAVQIGLFANLTEGVIVHFGALALGLVGAVVYWRVVS